MAALTPARIRSRDPGLTSQTSDRGKQPDGA
jgi:hypothetical protein